MEINKTYLEDKLQMFVNKQTELTKIINDNITLSRKIEGAIEAIQLLLKELNTEANAN